MILWLLAATVVGTIIFAALMVTKPVTQKLFSSTWHYYMSFVPVFFLLGGVVVASLVANHALTHLPELPSAQPVSEDTVSVFAPAGRILPTHEARPAEHRQELTMPYTQMQMASEPTSPESTFVELAIGLIAQYAAQISLILLGIWAIGFVVVAINNLRKYSSFRKLLLQNSRDYAIESPIPVKISSIAKTPMMLGFTKPMIILPEVKFHLGELRMIMAHELIHYKRKDVWLKFAVFMATAIHWFNPLVRLLSKHIHNLCELSCDEKAVMEMDNQERRLYGETILFMLHRGATGNLVCTNGLCNTKKNIKRRLLNMLNTKKVKKSMIALSLAITTIFIAAGGVAAYGANRIMPLGSNATEAYVTESYDSEQVDDLQSSRSRAMLNINDLRDGDNNQPGENSISREQAEAIGLAAIENLLGYDVGDATLWLSYEPRRYPMVSVTNDIPNADYYTDMFNQAIIDNGIMNDRYIATDKFANLFPELNLSDFSLWVIPGNPESRWNGRVGDFGVPFFTLFAETGEIQTIGHGTRRTFSEVGKGSNATVAQNHEVAQYAMQLAESLNILDTPTRARIVYYRSAGVVLGVIAEPNDPPYIAASEATVHIESANGELVEMWISGFMEDETSLRGIRWGIAPRPINERFSWCTETGESTTLPALEWVNR